MDTSTRAEEHTPGPWKLERDGGRMRVRNRVGYVADVLVAGINPDVARENVANAALIAAAPELLEALRLVCDLNPSQHHIDEVARRHAIARAAIARATAPTPEREAEHG
jgi:hypothetical protein